MDFDKLLSVLRQAAGKLALMALCLICAAVALSTLKETPAAVVAVVFGVLALLFLVFLPTDQAVTAEMESKEWLKLLERHLKDATEIKAYLRAFKHPDHMKAEYRDDVLALMRVFVNQLAEHNATFRLLAYHNQQGETDPCDWLKAQLGKQLGGENGSEHAAAIVTQCIQILAAQPYPNSSTIYVIDKRIIMYSYSSDGTEAKHYKMTLNGSIVPVLIAESIARYFPK